MIYFFLLRLLHIFHYYLICERGRHNFTVIMFYFVPPKKKIFFIKWRFLPSYHFHTQSFESVHHKSKTNPNNLIKSVRLISIFAFSHIFFPHSLFHPHFISNLRMTWHFLVQRFPFCCSFSFNFHKLLCFWLNKAPPILIFFLQTFLTLNWHSCNFGLNGKLRVHFN